MTALWFTASVLIVSWLVGVFIAWVVNHNDLIRRYGEAPFNWRLFTYHWLYTPWLADRQQNRLNKRAGQ